MARSLLSGRRTRAGLAALCRPMARAVIAAGDAPPPKSCPPSEVTLNVSVVACARDGGRTNPLEVIEPSTVKSAVPA
jgi:hypothetical protein